MQTLRPSRSTELGGCLGRCPRRSRCEPVGAALGHACPWEVLPARGYCCSGEGMGGPSLCHRARRLGLQTPR